MANIWEIELTDDSQQTDKKDFPVLPAGRYEFEVEQATGKEYTPSPTSKIGKCAEIDLRLRVEPADGSPVLVFDRLYSDPKTIWKMTAFAKCVGIFKAGMTPADVLKACTGCIGIADIKVTPASGQYAAKNEVKAYLPKQAPTIEDQKDLPF